MRAVFFSSVLLTLAGVGTTADDIVKRELKAIPGRTYALYVPPSSREGEKLPLLITLHGSGRDGRSLVEKWRPLARQERIVVAGPDAINRQGWQFPADGPYAQFQSDYDSGYATGQKERREFLARGKDEKYIRDYASGMLAGYTDVSISRMTGAPGPGRIVALHRLTLKH